MAASGRGEGDALLVKAQQVMLWGAVQVDVASSKVQELLAQLREKDEDYKEHLGLAWGLALALFGGQFPTTFAFIEAIHQSGWEALVVNVRTIQGQINSATEAIAEDNLLDEDMDGTPDVQQISKEDLVKRRVNVFLKAVDPEVAQKALSALWLSFLSASAAVKLKFANVIALGTSMGEFIDKPAQRHIVPNLITLVETKYHRWLPSFVQYICRLIGIAVAFRMNRILATIATAIRGGDVLIQSISRLCKKKGIELYTSGPLDEMLTTSVVAMGIYAQLFGPQSPFIFRLLFFPLAISEQTLTLWVGSS